MSVARYTTPEATHRLCTVGALPVALARMGMRIDRSLLLEPLKSVSASRFLSFRLFGFLR